MKSPFEAKLIESENTLSDECLFMEIPKLKLKRRKNVQEQNAVTKEFIHGEAEYYRIHGIPKALQTYGESQGIDWEHSIILELDIDYPGIESLVGLLLTQKRRFINFELETDEKHSAVIAVEKWEDVTEKQNFSEHNPGTGIGYGALALTVWQELESKDE